MELSTDYMGLALRNPLVASASPLSKTVDGVRRLADAGVGVGAVVLYSLFEEQLRREAALNARLADAGTESFGESLTYFPDVNRFLQPDIDPDSLAVVPGVDLSSPAEARLPRTWIALLHGRVRAALAATIGVEEPADVAKYLLAGAPATSARCRTPTAAPTDPGDPREVRLVPRAACGLLPKVAARSRRSVAVISRAKRGGPSCPRPQRPCGACPSQETI